MSKSIHYKRSMNRLRNLKRFIFCFNYSAKSRWHEKVLVLRPLHKLNTINACVMWSMYKVVTHF